MNNRTEWIDFAKGLCIILIVTGHIINGYLFSYPVKETGLLLFSNIIYTFHVHVFFFFAGYLFHRSFSSRGIRDYIIEKIKTILYPYFIWSIIQGCVEVFLSNYTAVPLSSGELFRIIYEPISQFWFLYSLFIISILFAVCAHYGKTALRFIIIISIVLYFCRIPTKIMDLENISIFMLFFSSGIISQKYLLDEKISGMVHFPGAVFTMGLFIVASYWSYTKILYLDIMVGAFPFFKMLYGFFLSGMGVIGVVVLSKYLCRLGYYSVVCKIGYYSLAIFCTHGFFGSGCRIVLNKFFNCLNPNIFIPISVLSGVVFPIILYKIAVTLKIPYLFVLKKEEEIQPCPY
jgi:fucose 4-O-acetylase-like acetyltransferase